MNDFYYHATSVEAAKSILRQGFKCSKSGMNGTGVYFADNPVSALFKAHVINPGAIIVAKVNVGRKTLERCSHQDWNLQKIKEKGFDCVQTNCRSGPEICIYEPWRITIVETYYLKELYSEAFHTTHFKYFHETNSFKTFEVNINFKPNNTFLYDVICIMKNICEEKTLNGGCNIGDNRIFTNFTLFNDKL